MDKPNTRNDAEHINPPQQSDKQRSAQIIYRGWGKSDEAQVRQNSTDGGRQGNQEMKTMLEEDTVGRTLKTGRKVQEKKRIKTGSQQKSGFVSRSCVCVCVRFVLSRCLQDKCYRFFRNK